MKEITQDLLLRTFNYNPETGEYLRKIPSKFKKCLTPCKDGSDRKKYKVVSIFSKTILVHRIIFMHVYGRMPNGCVDHINGIRSDNRLCNLREVDHQGNNQNYREPTSRNTSGYLGVCWDKKNSKWKSSITLNGKSMHIGSFDDPKIAHEAYLAVKRNIHPTCTI